jgi:hypothetical protein
MLPFHLPGLPLRVALADETISIFLVGQETENGISATHVRLTQVISNAKVRGSDQDWWFDPTTGLPLRVGYLIPTQTEHLYAHLLWNFGGWSQEGSLTLPHQLAQSLNGEMTLQVCNVLGIKTNSGPAAAIFDAR